MKKIFILTGEPSGDKLASKVISKLQKDNPNIENLLTILGTNINAGNVEFDARTNPSEDIQIIIGKDYQEFLNLNQ